MANLLHFENIFFILKHIALRIFYFFLDYQTFRTHCEDGTNLVLNYLLKFFVMKIGKLIRVFIICSLLVLCNDGFILAQGKDKAIGNTVGSETFKTAIGLRAGGTSGLTIKQFFETKKAIEGIFGVYPRGFSFTGLYEIYTPAGVNGLNFYYGAGAHAGMLGSKAYYMNGMMRMHNDVYYYSDNNWSMGLDGILGIEYKIIPIPFALSLDMKPYIELNTAGRVFISLDPGIGIKVAF